MKSLLPSRRKPPPAPPSSDPAPLDPFSLLPIELLLAIFSHLPTPSSVLAALNVSRTWRALILLPDISRPLALRFLPGPLPPSASFHAALLAHHLRASGHFSSTAHRSLLLDGDPLMVPSLRPPLAAGGVHDRATVAGLDLADGDDEHNARVKLHSHGRLAWWPEAWFLPFFAVVDDVRAGTRRMFLFPGQAYGSSGEARRGWKTAMGEVLFVMGQEDVGVCVWHLERDEMKRVGLPGAFERCVVEGERILFVGRRRGDVWLWRWGDGAVTVVDVAGLGCYPAGPVAMGGQVNFAPFQSATEPPDPRPGSKVGLRFRDTDVKLDFILHPTDADVFFVITYDDNVLVVYEIVAGKLGDTIVLPREHVAARVLRASRRNNAVHYLRHEPCDAHGGYCLITAWLGSRPPEEPICDGTHSDDCPPSSLGSVCFNVYTKKITAFVHHVVYQGTPRMHLWDGLVAVGASGRRKSTDALEALVMLLSPCDSSHDFPEHASLDVGDEINCLRIPRGAAKDVVRYEPFHPSVWDVVHRPGRLDRVACALATDGWVLEAWPPEVALDTEMPEWLSGDERTLVYVVGKEYAIWTFGEGGIAAGPKKEDRWGKAAWREKWRSVTKMGG
ncbi:hypothetical protein QBC39DRAFT_298783 [Podospora conica]|nr:hypothetical protein QBC39DRAFT_298783 [Schizothecium conicum]